MVASTMDAKKDEKNKAELDDAGRDIKILDAFEFADYQMLRLLYYHFFVDTSVEGAPRKDKIAKLPPDVLPFTHQWKISYSRDELVEKMDSQFWFFHIRSSLISLVGAFEGALSRFVNRLEGLGEIQRFGKGNKNYPNKLYGTRLSWAIKFAIDNKEILYDGETKNLDSKPMIEKLPEVCAYVDEARRFRNLFTHDRGLFNEKYGKAINIEGIKPRLHPLYLKYLSHPKSQVAVVLTPEEFFEYNRSHIELLHDLHDLIQRKCFRLTGAGYYYPGELPRLKPKRDEWDRVFSGRDSS